MHRDKLAQETSYHNGYRDQWNTTLWREEEREGGREGGRDGGRDGGREGGSIGVGTNGAGGAIAPPLFYRKKETHLLALQTAKQTGLNVTGRLAYSPQRYFQ